MPDRWQHQQACLDRYAHCPAFALEWDMRCGKSRAALEHAMVWHRSGKIDAILLVAYPRDVHHNWVRLEIPEWIGDQVPWRAMAWRSERAATNAYEREFDDLLKFEGLAVFALNADAISDRKEKGGGPKKKARVKIFMHRFIEAKRVFLIVDEVDWCEDPRSARSQTIQKVAYRPNVVAKRILGGTLGADSPFGYFVPYSLLAPPKQIFNLPDYFAFTHRYGEWKRSDAVPQYEMRYDRHHGRMILVIGDDGFPKVKKDASGNPIAKPGIVKAFNYKTRSLYEVREIDDEGNPRYRNLDELRARLDPWRMVVKRSDVSDAPPKIYQRLFYEMSREQRRVYEDLRDRGVTQLSSGSVVEVNHVLTLLLRLQQVLGNHLPGATEGVVCGGCDGTGCVACDDLGIVVRVIPGRIIDQFHNPRLDALIDLMDREPMPTLVWARFTSEVDELCSAIAAKLDNVVRFDGQVGSDVRLAGRDKFQAGLIDYIVGNQATGARGLRMDHARRVIFYSNSFSGKTREQGEDRAEAIDRRVSTIIIDLCCEGTVDERVASAHVAKKSIKAMLSGEGWKEFFR